MYTCIICRFQVPLDDTEGYNQRTGACVCLGCWTRECATTLRVPDRLRQQLIAITGED